MADARLRLPPGHRRLEFDFTALSFAAPENVQFRHRWKASTTIGSRQATRRTATYPRLPAGNYVFHVTACRSDGVWNKSGATLSVVVAPFLWQTWWFRSAALAAFTLVIIAIVRYVSFRRLHEQLRQLEQQAALHKERARIAKDIHDDLGANLTQIALLGRTGPSGPRRAGQGRRAQRQDFQHRPAGDQVARRNRLGREPAQRHPGALDRLRRPVRARLPAAGGHPLPAGFSRADTRARILHRRAPQLFLVVKEAINNIVKHSRATEVWLRASRHGRQACGSRSRTTAAASSAPPTMPGADGLRNMRQRLAEIGGECRIESKIGVGTKISFELPWPSK